MGLSSGRADHRGQVLDFPVNGVRRGIAAVAAAATVVAVDGEPLGQQFSQLDLAGVTTVAEGSADEHERLPGSGTVVGDRSPVERVDGVHDELRSAPLVSQPKYSAASSLAAPTGASNGRLPDGHTARTFPPPR